MENKASVDWRGTVKDRVTLESKVYIYIPKLE